MRRNPSSAPAYGGYQQHSSLRGGSARQIAKQDSLDDEYEIEFSDVDDGDFVVGGGGNTAGTSSRQAPGAGGRSSTLHPSKSSAQQAAGTTGRITSAPPARSGPAAQVASTTRRPATAAAGGGSDSLDMELDLSGDLDISFSDDGHTSGTARRANQRAGAAPASGKGGVPGGARTAFTSAADSSSARPSTRGKQGQLGGGLSSGMAGTANTASGATGYGRGSSSMTAGGSSGSARTPAGVSTGRAGAMARGPGRQTQELSLSMSDVSGDIVLGGTHSSQSLEIEFSDEEGGAHNKKQGSGVTKGTAGPGGRAGSMMRASIPDIEIMSLDGPGPTLTHVKSKGRPEPKVESFSIEFSDMSNSGGDDDSGSIVVGEPAAPASRSGGGGKPPLPPSTRAGAVSQQLGARGASQPSSGVKPASAPPAVSRRHGSDMSEGSSLEISGADSSIEIEHSEDEEVTTGGNAKPAPLPASQLSALAPPALSGSLALMGGSGRLVSPALVSAAASRLVKPGSTAPAGSRTKVGGSSAGGSGRLAGQPVVRRLSRTPDSTPDISGTDTDEDSSQGGVEEGGKGFGSKAAPPTRPTATIAAGRPGALSPAALPGAGLPSGASSTGMGSGGGGGGASGWMGAGVAASMEYTASGSMEDDEVAAIITGRPGMASASSSGRLQPGRVGIMVPPSTGGHGGTGGATGIARPPSRSSGARSRSRLGQHSDDDDDEDGGGRRRRSGSSSYSISGGSNDSGHSRSRGDHRRNSSHHSSHTSNASSTVSDDPRPKLHTIDDLLSPASLAGTPTAEGSSMSAELLSMLRPPPSVEPSRLSSLGLPGSQRTSIQGGRTGSAGGGAVNVSGGGAGAAGAGSPSPSPLGRPTRESLSMDAVRSSGGGGPTGGTRAGLSMGTKQRKHGGKGSSRSPTPSIGSTGNSSSHLQPQQSSRSHSSSHSLSGRPRLMGMDALEAASSHYDGQESVASVTATEKSEDARPRLMTLDDLQSMTSGSVSALSHKSEVDAQSEKSGDDRPRLMGIQDLEATSLSGSIAMSEEESVSSAASSDGRPRLMTVDQLMGSDSPPLSPAASGSDASKQRDSLASSHSASSASLSALSSSASSTASSGDRPRLMTLDQLQAIEIDAGEDDADPLAGLTMVRTGSEPSTSSSSGGMSGRSGRHLYPITEGGSTDAAGGLASGPKDSGVPSPSYSSPSSQGTASFTKAPSQRHAAGAGGGVSGSGDSWGVGRAAAAGAGGDMSGSGDLGTAPIAPTWRTVSTHPQHAAHFQDSSTLDASMDLSEQEDQGPQQGGTAAARHGHFGSKAGNALPEFVPSSSLPRAQQGYGSAGGAAQQQLQPQAPPAAVFGLTRQPAPLPTTSAGTQTAEPVVIDLTPLGLQRKAAGPVPLRTVALQVGSMNEVSTQVAFDPRMERLVEGATPGPLTLPPGLTGLGVTTSVTSYHHTILHPHRQQDGQLGAAGMKPTTLLTGGLYGGSMANTGSTSIMSAAAGSTLPYPLNAVGGELAGSYPLVATPGWGVLTLAAQNLKAATLLQQVEAVAAATAMAAAATGAGGGMGGMSATGGHTANMGGHTSHSPHPAASSHDAMHQHSHQQQQNRSTSQQQQQQQSEGISNQQNSRPTTPSGPPGSRRYTSPLQVTHAGSGRIAPFLSAGGAGGSGSFTAGAGVGSPFGALLGGGGSGHTNALGQEVGGSGVLRPAVPHMTSLPTALRAASEFLAEPLEQSHGMYSLDRQGRPSTPPSQHQHSLSITAPAAGSVGGNDAPVSPRGQPQLSPRHRQVQQQHERTQRSSSPLGNTPAQHHTHHHTSVTQGGSEGGYSEEGFESESGTQSVSTAQSGEAEDHLQQLGAASGTQQQRTGVMGGGTSHYPHTIRHSSSLTYTADFASFSQGGAATSMGAGGHTPVGGGHTVEAGAHSPPPSHLSHVHSTSMGGGSGRYGTVLRPRVSGSGTTPPAAQSKRISSSDGTAAVLPVSRRLSTTGITLGLPTEIPEVNTMDTLTRPSFTAPALVPDASQPQQQQQQQQLHQTPTRHSTVAGAHEAGGRSDAAGGAGRQQQVEEVPRTAGAGTTLTGLLGSPGVGTTGSTAASTAAPQAPGHTQHQAAQAQSVGLQFGGPPSTGNAAHDTLMRFHALLSSGGLPGGVLDPVALGRLRTELLAGAAAAVQSSGLKHAHVAQEVAGDSVFRSDLDRLRSRLGAWKQYTSTSSTTTTAYTMGLIQPSPLMPMSATAPPAAFASSNNMGSGFLQASGVYGSSTIQGGGVLGADWASLTATAPLSRDREVVVDPATRKLVDVGGPGAGVRGAYTYTTLADTLAFIRSYQPARPVPVRQRL